MKNVNLKEKNRYYIEKMKILRKKFTFEYIDNDKAYVIVPGEQAIYIIDGYISGHYLRNDKYIFEEEGTRGTFIMKKRIEILEYEILFTSTYEEDNFDEMLEKAEIYQMTKKFKI